MKKFVTLILFLCLSFNAFSQKDTTAVTLSGPIARLVIKDLITGDGLRQEIEQTNQKLKLLAAKCSTQGNIIVNFKQKVSQLNLIIELKDSQYEVQEKLSKDLSASLKRQKLKTKVLTFSLPVLILGALLIK